MADGKRAGFRIVSSVATLALICASVAAAAASYETGLYTAGTKRGLKTPHYYAGVNINNGWFDVRRISLIAQCEDGSTSGWHFVKGSVAQIRGKIRSTGRFSGRYEEPSGYFQVKGRVKGSKATMTATFVWGRGSTNAADNCRSEHTFALKARD